MATYLDIYGAVKRGIRQIPDLALELYESPSLVRMAVNTLRQLGVLEVRKQGTVAHIEVAANVVDKAGAVAKAQLANFDLSAEIPGSRPRITLFPSRRRIDS
jgi:hypothetical protein